jgi:hypothetical protein
MLSGARAVFLPIAAFLTIPFLLPAASGGITGKIVEPDGKPSPSALVTVIERSSGAARVLTAGEDGAYSAPDLMPGLYDVSARSARTGASASSTVELSSGGSVELSLRLSGEWNIFDVHDPASAPFSAGNYLDLLRNGSEITRGEEGGNIEGYGPYSTRGDLSFNSIGMRGQDNNFLLDGMDNNDAWLRGPVITSPVGEIESVTLDAVYIPASEGHAAGGVVDVLTRAGSSAWHGTGFEFFGNSSLNTRNFFDGAMKPGVTQNQFGGSVGGPVVGKSWFFYLSADALRARDGLTVISTVPTADEKAGNFGAEAIYNPLTLTETGPTSFTSQPFQLNRIPASLIPLQAQNLINLYPDPNLPGLADNFRFTPASISNSQRYAFRTDKTFTPRDTLFFRINYERNNNLSPSALPGDAGGDLTQHADDANVHVAASGAAIGQTFAVRPSLINDFRLGFSRLDWNGVPLDQSVNPAVTLGIPGLTPGGLPVVSPEGYAQLGASQGVPGEMRSTSYELRDSVRWTTARHHFVFGTHIVRRHVDGDTTDWTSRGTFIFTPDYTDLPGVPYTGNSIASLLTGYPAEVRRDVQFQPYLLRGWEMEGFAQDTFRIGRRLTISAGVLYSHYPPVTEANNQMVNFNFGNTYAALDRFAGEGGVNKYGGLDYNKLTFAPRIGIAWDLSSVLKLPPGSTVLRGAFSRDYEPGAYIAEGILARNPPYESNLDMFNGSLNVGPTLAGGLPAPSSVALTNPASLIAAQTSIYAIQPVAYTPYADQWGLFLDHRLKRGLTMEIAGMGSMGIHLYETYNINPPIPLPIPTNPQRYPYSVDDTRIQYLGFAGGSTYYGGQAKLAGQISRGLQLLATYRYAKSVDDATEPETFQESRPPEPQNTYKLRGNRSPSPFDVPQRLVANVTYDLPLRDSGHGRMLETIFGNWRLAGTATVQSGLPFTPWLATNDLDNDGIQLPNRVGSGALPGDVRSPMQWFNTSLNPSAPGTAFLIPPLFQFGNSGFDILRGPRLATVDSALSRTFPVRERIHIQTRIEAYNLFNRANFALPNPILDLDSSGVISHTITPSRNLRLVARVDW